MDRQILDLGGGVSDAPSVPGDEINGTHTPTGYGG